MHKVHFDYGKSWHADHGFIPCNYDSAESTVEKATSRTCSCGRSFINKFYQDYQYCPPCRGRMRNIAV